MLAERCSTAPRVRSQQDALRSKGYLEILRDRDARQLWVASWQLCGLGLLDGLLTLVHWQSARSDLAVSWWPNPGVCRVKQ